MSTLRSRLIRLAHNNPDLRPKILPLLAKTAGNMGEVNPFMLDDADPTWVMTNDNLLGEIETAAGKVGALALSASRKGIQRASGMATEDTEELYNQELKARLISAVHRAIKD